MKRLEGKTALITGAGRGLGASICRRFVDEGATVLLNDVDEATASATAQELDARYYVADVSDSSSVGDMFEAIRRDVGCLDVLVNNAGISGVEQDEERRERWQARSLQQVAEVQAGGPVETHLDFTVEATDEEWRRMLAVHLDGTFYCTRAALAIMNPQMSGAIINMGSIMGTTGGAGGSRLLRRQGGDLGFHPLACARGRHAWHSRQRHCARLDRNRHDGATG